MVSEGSGWAKKVIEKGFSEAVKEVGGIVSDEVLGGMEHLWRPKGWRNPFASNQTGIPSLGVSDALLFERGAEAMLEALKEQGSYLDGSTTIPAQGDYPEIHVPGGTKGWVILVPEEGRGDVSRGRH